eukprot:6203411-Pleurochrysis_carterae.AAC.2
MGGLCASELPETLLLVSFCATEEKELADRKNLCRAGGHAVIASAVLHTLRCSPAIVRAPASMSRGPLSPCARVGGRAGCAGLDAPSTVRSLGLGGFRAGARCW